ncbi:tRNA pseudouridine(38-40) synthase TruA [Lacisediminihabitans profunda]|uniref:tRNA pseudouridine(38-40) synthase TruA n=1 Tax=Lacisediminihabitans profunda TaxID=2594790 RepID=UPI001FE2BEED|nr:tRNA pseudouridine(38-40) synthase TruA [Lacisediminihabitans profunda]
MDGEGVIDAGAGYTRIRLDIAYDGGNFNGWTKQPGLRTVQGELEAALAIIFGRRGPAPTLTVAGRTDAGVHATGQVAHLDLSAEQLGWLTRPRGKKATGGRRFDGPTALGRRLNGIAGLETDVYVSRAVVAPEGFDARFSAVWRRYEYRVSDNSGPRNPLERNRTLWYPAALDLDRMAVAAESLVGLHDWAAYCKPREGATTIRTLQEFAWRRDADGVLVAEVKADAFCHSMVRSLVGATIAVGEGKLEVERLTALRDELDRTSEFNVVPAKGLTLVEIGYPPDDELAARAEVTRARRPPLETSGTAAFDRIPADGLI